MHATWKEHIESISDDYKGTTPTESESDPKGFDVGKEYFVELWPEDKVRYYNAEGTLDLTGSIKDIKEPFYLKIRLFPVA